MSKEKSSSQSNTPRDPLLHTSSTLPTTSNSPSLLIHSDHNTNLTNTSPKNQSPKHQSSTEIATSPHASSSNLLIQDPTGIIAGDNPHNQEKNNYNHKMHWHPRSSSHRNSTSRRDGSKNSKNSNKFGSKYSKILAFKKPKWKYKLQRTRNKRKHPEYSRASSHSAMKINATMEDYKDWLFNWFLLSIPSIGFFGCQLSWALQIGFVTPELERLGLSATLVNYAWLAGPISGIIVQPIVGIISDNIEYRQNKNKNKNKKNKHKKTNGHRKSRNNDFNDDYDNINTNISKRKNDRESFEIDSSYMNNASSLMEEYEIELQDVTGSFFEMIKSRTKYYCMYFKRLFCFKCKILCKKLSIMKGKRRPFIFIGGICVMLSLLMFSNAKWISMNIFGADTSDDSVALIIAIVAFWLLDVSTNITQAPLRALLSDIIPHKWHDQANGMFGTLNGVGLMIGYGLGYFLGYTGDSSNDSNDSNDSSSNDDSGFGSGLTILYGCGAIIVGITCIITIIYSKSEKILKIDYLSLHNIAFRNYNNSVANDFSRTNSTSNSSNNNGYDHYDFNNNNINNYNNGNYTRSFENTNANNDELDNVDEDDWDVIRALKQHSDELPLKQPSELEDTPNATTDDNDNDTTSNENNNETAIIFDSNRNSDDSNDDSDSSNSHSHHSLINRASKINYNTPNENGGYNGSGAGWNSCCCCCCGKMCQIWQDLKRVPLPIIRAWIVQFWVYFSHFTTFIYLTDWFGKIVTNGEPNDDSLRTDYENGVKLGNVGLTLLAFISIIVSLCLPRIIPRIISYQVCWMICMLEYAIVLICLSLLEAIESSWLKNNQTLEIWIAIILIGLIGIPFAASMVIPWTIVTQTLIYYKQECNGKEGLFTTVFNSSQCFSEIVVAVGAGSVITAFNDDISSVLFAGGIGALIGMISCLGIIDPTDCRSPSR